MKRANRAQEELTRTRDLNTVTIGMRGLDETARHNLAWEAETSRHNSEVERQADVSLGIQQQSVDVQKRNAATNERNAATNWFNAQTNRLGWQESTRHNQAMEGYYYGSLAESQRHNTSMESLQGRQIDVQAQKVQNDRYALMDQLRKTGIYEKLTDQQIAQIQKNMDIAGQQNVRDWIGTVLHGGKTVSDIFADQSRNAREWVNTGLRGIDTAGRLINMFGG
nr:ORF1 [Mute swan feces associated picobirnavirus A]